MVGSRTLTAVAGVLGSLLVSAVLWSATGSAVFFLVVPFVPFLFGRAGGPSPGADDERAAPRTCPSCGFRTTDPTHEYCPRDGRRLD